jgi:hypothetical protein
MIRLKRRILVHLRPRAFNTANGIEALQGPGENTGGPAHFPKALRLISWNHPRREHPWRP